MTRKQLLGLKHISTKEVVVSEICLLVTYLITAVHAMPEGISFWWLLAGCIILLTAFGGIRNQIMLMINDRRCEKAESSLDEDEE